MSKKLIKVKLYRCPDIGMVGAELTKVRKARHFTRADVARRMGLKGWNWYDMKATRLEKLSRFYLHPKEMRDLLTILGASGV